MDFIKTIVELFEDKVEVIEGMDYPTFKVKKEDFLSVVTSLKTSEVLEFTFLIDLTAVEYDEYFEAVYHLMNLSNKQIIRLKVQLDKNNPSIASLTRLYKAADLQEKETYDLMGINYEGHEGLKRVLCPDDFEGHPLRKDYVMPDRGSK
ncbi:MAG: NADH-quinone oxidoreductase subunit C [Bacillota bacterium]